MPWVPVDVPIQPIQDLLSLDGRSSAFLLLSVYHQKGLAWTQKKLGGKASIVFVGGDPQDWQNHGFPDNASYTGPTNPISRSLRLALAFQYHSRDLFFSDAGYKEIFSVRLRQQGDQEDRPDMQFVYSGISTEVRGMAMDWVTGNLYWTDALFNWISVTATTKQGVYRHLVTTGLDKPFGIAVHPKYG